MSVKIQKNNIEFAPLIRNAIPATLVGLLSAKGLQIANNSYHFVKNSSLIVNPSKIAAPLLLASFADYLTRKVLDRILPGQPGYGESLLRKSSRTILGSAVKVGVLMALSGPAGASVALVEAIAFTALSEGVGHLGNRLAKRTVGIPLFIRA